MEKCRILHVAQAAGGVERYIQVLLKYLDKEKYENILVCSEDYNKASYEGIIAAFRTIEMQRAIGMWDLKSIVSVRKLIKKYKPDIVYAHSSKAGFITRIANLGLNNYCIYNPHGWAFNMRTSGIRKNLYSIIEKWTAALCEKIICISESEKESALEKKICKEEKLQVIFNGIDIDACKQSSKKIVRSDLKIPEDAFVVGMVGRICIQKAPDIFVEAAKLIRDKIPTAHFVLVGSGELQSQINEYVKLNGLEGVMHITGWVENPIDYIRLFDVACLLSRWEGFGLVLPEYMITGKPIVACNVDAIPNIIKNEINGLLVEVDNKKSVCDAVMKIYTDTKLQDQLVKNGYQLAYEKFDARRMAAEHEEIFEKQRGNYR